MKMFLQKEASYQSGDYVGEDEEGELYKRDCLLYDCGSKNNLFPHVIQAIPEVTITGEWLAEKNFSITSFVSSDWFLLSAGLLLDNHNSNVNAFKSLKQKFGKGDQLFHTSSF